MPLPLDNATWPPAEWATLYQEYRTFAALYAGDVDALMAVATGTGAFWGRMAARKATQRARLHVPLASDIAATNATLLFAEDPEIIIPEAHEDPKQDDAEEGDEAEESEASEAVTQAQATEERLREIMAFGDTHSRFIEAAETSSAFGGVFIKTDWDKNFAIFPILSVVQPDNAVPEFKYGMLHAVTLWKVLDSPDDGYTVWRHLERHEPGLDGKGIILHGLYEGTSESLGVRRDLSQHEETKDLETRDPETGERKEFVKLPFAGIAVRYIPNLLPNRRHRGQPIGRSDYAGAESLFDALDECYASWMRDIRLGKARLVVPESALELASDGELEFDTDQEVYAPLSVLDSQKMDITATQFAIRVDEHQRTAEDLLKRIVLHAGYSPQTFGLDLEGGGVTATEIRSRERKSLSTQQMKRSYWESSLEDLLENALIIDRDILKNPTVVFRPSVTMADSLIPDEGALADTIEKLYRAKSASIEIRVRMQHPDWDNEQVQAEAQRIREEEGLAVLNPFEAGVA